MFNLKKFFIIILLISPFFLMSCATTTVKRGKGKKTVTKIQKKHKKQSSRIY